MMLVVHARDDFFDDDGTVLPARARRRLPASSIAAAVRKCKASFAN